MFPRTGSVSTLFTHIGAGSACGLNVVTASTINALEVPLILWLACIVLFAQVNGACVKAVQFSRGS